MIAPIVSFSPRLRSAFSMIAVLAFVAGDVAAEPACAEAPSWIFQRSRFSHDPMTGARVAQYSRIRPVEPLSDPRSVTSVYRRSRTVLRGADGSMDSHYQVQGYGNGRGGLDAEWERFHDAWKESTTAGGYNQSQYGSYPTHGYGHGGPGYSQYPHGGNYPPGGQYPPGGYYPPGGHHPPGGYPGGGYRAPVPHGR